VSTWDDGSKPRDAPLGVANMAVAGMRVLAIAVVIFGFMGPMLLLRLLGFIQSSQRLVQVACRLILMVMGLEINTVGSPMQMPGGVVANHSTWLDIFVLNAVQKVLFVSKAEVAKWPLIGMIARSVGTVFIERKQSDAIKQRDVFQDRLGTGHRLLFFPEGTSTDGRRVLAFKPTLFAAFFAPEVQNDVWIQAVTVAYFAPDGRDERYYGWWGDADFFPHFFNVLGQFRQGSVRVVFHPPVRVSDMADRKVLARATQESVAAGLADAFDVG
jgi:lyso-ornithine lipid O-acyltransferase